MTKSQQVNRVTTIIEFILDETGSMSNCLKSTINGFNNFIQEQKELDNQCLMTLTKFNANGLKTPYSDIDVNIVPKLTEENFIPGYNTNLYDTIIERISQRHTKLLDWDEKPQVLFVVMTDGYDNASRKTSNHVKSDIQNFMTSHDWTFVFLGAYKDCEKTAAALGFPPNNVKCFETEHMEETMQELSGAVRSYRLSQSVTSSENFYSSNV